MENVVKYDEMHRNLISTRYEMPEVVDEDIPEWDLDANTVVGLKARNYLNFSTTWGSRVDGGVTVVSASTKDATAIVNYGGRKGGKEGCDENYLEDLFCYEGWNYPNSLVCCCWFTLLNIKGNWCF